MASYKRTCFLMGSALASLAIVFPAQAEEVPTEAATMAESTDAIVQIETDADATILEAHSFDMLNALTSESEILVEDLTQAEVVTEPEQVASETLDDYLAESEAIVLDGSFTTSVEPLLETTDVAQSTEPAVAQSTESEIESNEVAQVTRPLYRGVSPFYVGVAGNIGIIGSGKSAVGDFGFNIISKVSLGPRFAVRPMVQFSEDDFNITLPVTFNFNPVELGRFSMYPSLGGGVDFGDDIGLLINGGIDVPISRDFTLNSQVNWRVTEDTGLGISLGVGYNFPVFFE